MEAALDVFDPLAAATGCRLLPGGAQVGRGEWQEGQMPCAS